MHTFRNYYTAVLVLLILAVSAINANSDDTAIKPIAKVNNTILTEADLQEALNEIMPAGVFHGGFSSEKRMQYKPQAIEKMIENELFYQQAIAIDLEADRSLIESRRKMTIKRLGGTKEFKAALLRAGLSDKQYQEKLEKKQLIEKLITTEITNKAQVSDREVLEYYQENKAKFVRPEARRIRQIQISVAANATPEERERKRLRAKEAIGKIEAGEDMAAVAWEYSEDRYRVKGGDLGLVHRGRLDPDLENEVFSLKKGQLSNILETIYGFHIVRVEEIKNPEQLPLEDISTKLKTELTQKKEQQLRMEFMQNIRAKAQIEVY